MTPRPLPRSLSHFRRVRGLLTHARVYPGPPDALPLVLLPGLGCASWMYRRLARQLAAARPVWVYDHPGMGLSQGRRGYPSRLGTLTDHVAAWMTLRGLEGVAVLGHSLGGEIAIDLAARYPALPARLILCAPTGIPENPSVRGQLARILQDAPRERPAFLGLALAAYLRCGLPRLYRLARDQDLHQTGELIPQVLCPALALVGSRDPVIRAPTLDVLRSRLPEGRGTSLRGGTHALMDCCPGEVAREVGWFLDGTDRLT